MYCVHNLVSHELDMELTEDDVGTVLRHLPNGESAC